MNDSGLKVGAFYWVLPDLDPSNGEDWRSEPQPARLRGHTDHGTTTWDFIGTAANDWSVRWVGPEIVSP